jgi:hypothetical protein
LPQRRDKFRQELPLLIVQISVVSFVNADWKTPYPRGGPWFCLGFGPSPNPVRKTSRTQVRRFAAKMPDGSRLQDVAQYVTHESRHLAAETHDGSSLPEALRQMAELVDKPGGDLAFT